MTPKPSSPRIGLIARADNRGLGIQTWEFSQHMHPAKTMVIDCPSERPLPLHFERFPDATIITGYPTARDFINFVDGLDVVFTCETPYNYELYGIALKRGVKTALQFNFEFLDRDPHVPRPDLYLAPSTWRYAEVPFANKRYLPVSIATQRFTINNRSHARRFLHIVGRPAIYDRNGTADLLKALTHIQSEITLTLRCQEPGYISGLIDELHIRTAPNVTLIINSADEPDYWNNYQGHDVLVMPRRFGGLCLPVNEALAAGMPVIMPRIDPNQWLPEPWLVNAHHVGEFAAKALIAIHSVEPTDLAATIDRFVADDMFYANACHTARHMAHELSWDTMKPEYDEVLTELCSR